MDMTSSTERRLADDLRMDRVAQLLAVYPDIGLEEKAEILRFLKKGPPLQVGLLVSRDELKPALGRFRGDHAREFSLGMKELLTAWIILTSLVVACISLWGVGARGG